MKKLKTLREGREAREYMISLFTTKELSDDLLREGSYMAKLLESFSAQPRLVIEQSKPSVESSHFYSWFNALCIRSYENLAVSDLYYLHEISHMTTLRYAPEESFDEWSKKMQDNEVDTSIETEVLIYFRFPSLRAKVFEFEIWADRFLSEKLSLSDSLSNSEFFQADEKEFTRRIKSLREQIYDIDESLLDDVEASVASYQDQNNQWYRIWANARVELESHVGSFYEEAKISPGEAIERHKNWLGGNGKDGFIPFENEALEFSEVYHAKKKADKEHQLKYKALNPPR